jgi:glucose uptake protein GlcU
MSKWIYYLRRIHLHSVGWVSNKEMTMKFRMKQFKIDNSKWWKVLKGAAIAAGAAVLTYAAQHLGDIDFGTSTPMVVAALAVGINYLRQVLVNVDPNDGAK